MTKADKIRALPDEELAYLFAKAQADVCSAVAIKFRLPGELPDIESMTAEWLERLMEEAK